MTILNNAEITQLAEQAGWPPDEIQNLLGVIGSESSGNTDVVAWGSGPNVLADSLGWPPPPAAAGYDEAAVGLTQELLSPASAVTPGAIEQLQNPEANLQLAYQKFQQSGWEPWTGDAYINAHPELLTQRGPGGTGAVSPTAGVSGEAAGYSLLSASPPPQSSDTFTQLMIQLDTLMNPGGGVFGLLTGSTEMGLVKMIIARGTFTTAFGILGIAALLGLVSGGKVGGKDIPGIAAGFLAGPDAGIANFASKLGIKVPNKGQDNAENLELRRQRLELQRTRETRIAAEAPQRAQREQERTQQAREREARISEAAPRRESRAERNLRLQELREQRLQRQMFVIDGDEF